MLEMYIQPGMYRQLQIEIVEDAQLHVNGKHSVCIMYQNVFKVKVYLGYEGVIDLAVTCGSIHSWRTAVNGFPKLPN